MSLYRPRVVCNDPFLSPMTKPWIRIGTSGAVQNDFFDRVTNCPEFLHAIFVAACADPLGVKILVFETMSGVQIIH